MLIKDIAIINPNKQHNISNFMNYIDTSSVFDSKLLNIQYLIDNFPSRAKRQVIKNDILISSVRPNLKHNYFMVNDIINCIASTGFIQVRIKNNNYHPRYIYYFLTNNTKVSLYTSVANTSQTTFPSFNKGVVENLKIPSISYDDQHSIVDIMCLP